MSDLFRKEVLEKQGQKLFGDVVLAAPLSHIMIAGLITLIMAGLVTFAILGEYARKERVVGHLSPDTGLIRILPRQAGVIEEIHVEAGDIVAQGAPLFQIKLDVAGSDGEGTAEKLLSQLEEEQAELNTRLAAIPGEYSMNRARINQQISAQTEEAARMAQQIELQTKAVDNQLSILEKFKSLLAQEAISSLEVSSQENRYLQSSLNLENLTNSREKMLSNIQDLRSQLRFQPVQQKKAVSDLRSRISAVQQRMTQAKGQGSYTMAAPVSGRVASLTARRGQTATGQAALATVLPSDGRLDAELFVPTRAAGFMKPGQQVRLLYDAFPYQKFGFHTGEIINVSKTIVLPGDLPLPNATQQPVFLVRVKLDRQDVDVNGEAYPLQAGMTLGADIILEERKIWEWVFEPVLGAMK